MCKMFYKIKIILSGIQKTVDVEHEAIKKQWIEKQPDGNQVRKDQGKRVRKRYNEPTLRRIRPRMFWQMHMTPFCQ